MISGRVVGKSDFILNGVDAGEVIAMENPRLLAAVQRRSRWLMAHPKYSIGLNRTNTAWCLYDRDDESRPIDRERVNTLDSDDVARAINALLDRHP